MSRPFTVLMSVIMGPVLASIACGGSSALRAESPAASPEVGAAPFRQSIGGIELASLDKGVVDEVAGATSEFQLELLRDYQITIAEYEMAMLAEAECLIRSGFNVNEDDLRLNGLGLITYTFGLGDQLTAETRARVASCSAEHSREIKMLWAVVTEPLVQEVGQRFRAWVAECLRDSGIAPEEVAQGSADPGKQEALSDCTRAAAARFDTGNISFGFEGDGRG